MKTSDKLTATQVRKVAQEVADYYGVPIEEIYGSSRKQEVVRVRRMTTYLCKEYLGISLPKIANALGHDSYNAEVRHYENMKAWKDRYPLVRDIVNDLSGKVTSIRSKNKVPLRFQKRA